MKKFAMSGTLGDAFIVYCKLYNFWKKTGKNIKLYRYSRHKNFDKPIRDFLANIPFIDYASPCMEIDKPISKGKKLIAPYINTNWHGKGGDFWDDDPHGMRMEPYPDCFIKKDPSVDAAKFNIGIQLHCGKPGSNYKGFSLGWLKKIVQEFSGFDHVNFYLFGTGEKYNLDKIEKFCFQNKVNNCIGKTSVTEWMSKIMAMDFMLTPLGFSCYFALVHKIPCLIFYDTGTRLIRISPEWARHAICLWPKSKNIFDKIKKRLLHYYHMKPIEPKQVKSIISLYYDYWIFIHSLR